MPSPDRPALHLQARAGQPLAIMLDASPGAGLLWQPPAAPTGCQLVAGPSVPGGAGDGGGMQQRFDFTAAAGGTHSLRFVLQRAWEDKPQAVLLVQVSVAN